jgi:hypothetical protein
MQSWFPEVRPPSETGLTVNRKTMTGSPGIRRGAGNAIDESITKEEDR